jgi:hypothetical protein
MTNSEFNPGFLGMAFLLAADGHVAADGHEKPGANMALVSP